MALASPSSSSPSRTSWPPWRSGAGRISSSSVLPETENVEANALAKLDRKGIDLVAANSVAGPDGAFGSDLNRLILLGRDGFRQALGPATKAVVAQQLIATLAARLAAPAR